MYFCEFRISDCFYIWIIAKLTPADCVFSQEWVMSFSFYFEQFGIILNKVNAVLCRLRVLLASSGEFFFFFNVASQPIKSSMHSSSSSVGSDKNLSSFL